MSQHNSGAASSDTSPILPDIDGAGLDRDGPAPVGFEHGGVELLAIPGPTVVPQRVLQAMGHPMVDIYDGELVAVTDEIFARLPPIAGSTGELFVTIGNGHAAWEMALSNTMSRGDRVLVLNCGLFASVWGEMAAKNGLIVDQIDAAPGTAVDPVAVGAALASDTEREIKAILTVQSDTASSVRNDIAAVRAAIDEAGHPALFMVDCIASLGCERFEMDNWGVDVVVAASQKGLMTPPGVSFNLVNERALEVHKSADLVTYYWDWTTRLDRSAHYMRYCGTPPVSHLYALREALQMIGEEGLEPRFERHALLAASVHAAVSAWSTAVGFSFHVPEPAQRSHAVTTVHTGDIDASELRRVCAAEFGVILGIGLHGARDRTFRIGHMGYVNRSTLAGIAAAIDGALDRLGFPTNGAGAAAVANG